LCASFSIVKPSDLALYFSPYRLCQWVLKLLMSMKNQILLPSEMGFRSSNFWLKFHLSLYFIKFDCHLASLQITLERTLFSKRNQLISHHRIFLHSPALELVVGSQVPVLDSAVSHCLDCFKSYDHPPYSAVFHQLL
jgi:hypothetical protein